MTAKELIAEIERVSGGNLDAEIHVAIGNRTAYPVAYVPVDKVTRSPWDQPSIRLYADLPKGMSVRKAKEAAHAN